MNFIDLRPLCDILKFLTFWFMGDFGVIFETLNFLKMQLIFLNFDLSVFLHFIHFQPPSRGYGQTDRQTDISKYWLGQGLSENSQNWSSSYFRIFIFLRLETSLSALQWFSVYIVNKLTYRLTSIGSHALLQLADWICFNICFNI